MEALKRLKMIELMKKRSNQNEGQKDTDHFGNDRSERNNLLNVMY